MQNNNKEEKANSQLTELERQEKVYRIVTEIEELTKQKNSANGGYRDQIKELKKELKDILVRDGKDVS